MERQTALILEDNIGKYLTVGQGRISLFFLLFVADGGDISLSLSLSLCILSQGFTK
jgi:hypothetical protein